MHYAGQKYIYIILHSFPFVFIYIPNYLTIHYGSTCQHLRKEIEEDTFLSSSISYPYLLNHNLLTVNNNTILRSGELTTAQIIIPIVFHIYHCLLDTCCRSVVRLGVLDENHLGSSIVATADNQAC